MSAGQVNSGTRKIGSLGFSQPAVAPPIVKANRRRRPCDRSTRLRVNPRLLRLILL